MLSRIYNTSVSQRIAKAVRVCNRVVPVMKKIPIARLAFVGSFILLYREVPNGWLVAKIAEAIREETSKGK